MRIAKTLPEGRSQRDELFETVSGLDVVLVTVKQALDSLI
jgi:hypothetical protein